MSVPASNLSADAARLGRVGRIDEHRFDSNVLRLVDNEVLQLPERPTMEPSLDALSCLDVGADMSQVFELYRGCSDLDGLCNDGLADFVVDVLDVATFAPGDSLEFALCGAATVGLKSFPTGKVHVTLVPQFAATEYLSGACDGEVVFANVNSHCFATFFWRNGWQFDKGVQIPSAIALDEYGFLEFPLIDDVSLPLAHLDVNDDPARQRVERSLLALDPMSPAVIVDGRWLECDCLNVFALAWLDDLICVGNPAHSLAHHLAAEFRHGRASLVVSKMMQGNAIPTAVGDDDWHQRIARFGEGGRQIREGDCLSSIRGQLERYGLPDHICEHLMECAESQWHCIHCHVDNVIMWKIW